MPTTRQSTTYTVLCDSEFERVRTGDLACRIWEQLKNAHAENAQVQARLFATYRREYEDFAHLPSESIDAMFQRFMVIVNNMRANVVMLLYDDHDRAIKLLQSLDRTVWSGKVDVTTRISANGNPTLCTSVIVLGRGYHVQSLSQVVQIHTTRE
jgi:hypothetical protein